MPSRACTDLRESHYRTATSAEDIDDYESTQMRQMDIIEALDFTYDTDSHLDDINSPPDSVERKEFATQKAAIQEDYRRLFPR